MNQPDVVVDNKKKVMASHIFGGEPEPCPRQVRPPPQNQQQNQSNYNQVRYSYPNPERARAEQARIQYETQQNLNQYNFVIPPRAQMPVIEDIPPPMPLPSITPFPDLTIDTKVNTDLGIENRQIQYNFTPINMSKDEINALRKLRADLDKEKSRFDYNLKNIVPEQAEKPNPQPKQDPYNRNSSNYPEISTSDSKFIYPDGSIR